jgi:hypothetical protein
MAILPSSAIQVVTQTSERLEILDPPRYLAGAVAVVVGVGLLWLGLRKRDTAVPIHWPYIVLALAAIFVGLALITGRGYIVLSRSEGTLTIQKQYFGVYSFPVRIRLGDIRSAVVESDSDTGHHKMILVLRSGEPVSVGTYTGQAGHYAAADAINDFLGVPKAPQFPGPIAK